MNKPPYRPRPSPLRMGGARCVHVVSGARTPRPTEIRSVRYSEWGQPVLLRYRLQWIPGYRHLVTLLCHFDVIGSAGAGRGMA